MKSNIISSAIGLLFITIFSVFNTNAQNFISETSIGTTTYDLQSNAAIQNRIVHHADGSISAGWTMSQEYNTSFSDRGTGYNFFDGTSWGAQPTDRLEASRGGWPSIIAMGSGKEASITHNSNFGYINSTLRPTIGSGSWFENPASSGNMIFNRSAVGGLNKETIHMIAVTASSNFGGATFNGLDGALVYHRSQDEGVSWDIQNMQLPGMDTSMFIGMNGDVYAIAAQGETVVVAYFDDWGDSFIVKSIDNGDTWTKTTFLDFPVDKYVVDDGFDLDGNGIFDRVYSSDNNGAVLLDANGQAHVFYGIMQYADEYLTDASTSWNPATNGISYWNESFGADNTLAMSNNDIWISDNLNIIATAPDLNGDGIVGGVDNAGGYALYYNSRASMPNAGCSANGDIYLSFSGYTETLDNGSQVFRHIYIIRSTDDGQTWSNPKDVTPHIIWNGERECVFPSMNPIVDDKIRIIYQQDSEPGLAVRGDEDIIDNNEIIYLEIDIAGLFATNSSTSNSTTAVSCDTYIWPVDGNTYTSSGVYTDIGDNFAGYTHTETLNLTINNSTSSIDTHVACDEFMWYCDGNTYTSSNNTATYVYTNSAGCDSTVTLNLTINNSTSISTAVTACDSYFWSIDGNTYTTSGTYTDFSTNANGCDHTEVLNLVINYSSNNTNILGVTNVDFIQTEAYSVVQNLNSIFSWHLNGGGVILSATNTNSVEVQWGSINGSYDLSLVETTQNGCSDTLLLVVNVNCLPNSGSSIITACDTYSWDGTAYTISGIYTNTFTNVSGCDSLITLDLTINNSTSNITSVTACDTYAWFLDGNIYTTSGTYTDVSTNTDGCDHTETLELTIKSVISSISQSGDSLFSLTTPIGLTANWYNIQTEDATTRIWLMEEGATTFMPRFDCSYFIVVSDNACMDTSEIYAYGENAARIGSFITSPNPTTGSINVKFENSKNQFVMFELISNNGSKLDEFITIEDNLNIDLSKYPSGAYYLYFNSEDAVQGCRLEELQKVSTKIILNK